MPGWIAQSERKRSAVRGAAADRLATEARHGVHRLPYGRALRRLADPRTRLRLMKVQPAARLFLRVRIWLRGQGVPFLSLFPQKGPFFYHTINSADTMIESNGKSRAPSKGRACASQTAAASRPEPANQQPALHQLAQPSLRIFYPGPAKSPQASADLSMARTPALARISAPRTGTASCGRSRFSRPSPLGSTL